MFSPLFSNSVDEIVRCGKVPVSRVHAAGELKGPIDDGFDDRGTTACESALDRRRELVECQDLLRMTAEAFGDERKVWSHKLAVPRSKINTEFSALAKHSILEISNGYPPGVVEHEVDNGNVLLDRKRQLLNCHQEVAVTRDADDGNIGTSQFCSQRCGNREPHRRVSTRREPRTRFVGLELLEHLDLRVARRGDHDRLSR